MLLSVKEVGPVVEDKDMEVVAAVGQMEEALAVLNQL